MPIVDKGGVLPNIRNRRPVVLELGCGNRKWDSEAIGIDIRDFACVDIIGDVVGVLKEIPDGVVDVVSSYHFLEHVVDLELLLAEAARVMRIGGRFKAVVPHFSNPYFYSDPTHKNHFGLYTFSYLAHDRVLRRKVPHYNPVSFRLMNVDLRFKSSRPFYIRHGVKRVLGMIFNSCGYMREFYEENLCYFFPCHEIEYTIEKVGVAEND
jgi:SAM-dependent methyltransferase